MGCVPENAPRHVFAGCNAPRHVFVPKRDTKHVDPTVKGWDLFVDGSIERGVRGGSWPVEGHRGQQLEPRDCKDPDDVPRLGRVRDSSVRYVLPHLPPPLPKHALTQFIPYTDMDFSGDPTELMRRESKYTSSSKSP